MLLILTVAAMAMVGMFALVMNTLLSMTEPAGPLKTLGGGGQVYDTCRSPEVCAPRG